MKTGTSAFVIIAVLVGLCPAMTKSQLRPYPIVDTGQEAFYDDLSEIAAPSEGEPFFGQDAGYGGLQPEYFLNGDGTVSDLVTGLMWQQRPDLENKMTFAVAVSGAAGFDLAGYDDWRLPTIKELYSLIDFRGSSRLMRPYIDTNYFAFRFGDESQGERLIDAQYWSATEYAGTTMRDDPTVFGVNFADGRIKGYPKVHPQSGENRMFVRYVRGNPAYGTNDFEDNGDGTVTDRATGLQWMKTGNGVTMNWQQALEYAEKLEYAGHSDWRLPDAKELQSIVDYTRAPDATDPARRSAAIDPVFEVSETESWYWSGTTLLESPPNLGSGAHAVYVTFGQAFGYMPDPGGTKVKLNVHGAGAQRSDPKSGDPADWEGGFGPQGDEIRIFNYVRCVRDAAVATGLKEDAVPEGYLLEQNFPNPFNPSTTIRFYLPVAGVIRLEVFSLLGQRIEILADSEFEAGTHSVSWNAAGVPGGIYMYVLNVASFTETKRMVLLK